MSGELSSVVPFVEAVRMALETIRTQKLKSFFSLIGVLIGVAFLIAVVSIVQGMNVFMEQKFATALICASGGGSQAPHTGAGSR